MIWRGNVFGTPGSLRRRLALNILSALALCLAMASAVLFYEFFEHLEENLEDSLIAEALEIVGQLDPDKAEFGLDPTDLRIRGPEGIYRYTLFDGAGNVLVGGETSREIAAQISAVRLGEAQRIALPGERFGMAVPVRVEGQDAVVLVSTFPPGMNRSQFERLWHEVEEELWLVALGVAMILVAAGLATHRALAPLEALRDQARRVGPANPERRLSRDDIPSELLPLIDAVNEAFDRLERGFRAQSEFSSNVAHEIRTPLAVLRSSIDRIADPDVRRSLSEDVRRLDRLFQQIVDLARADATGITRFETVDLREIAVGVATDLAGEAVRSGHDLTMSGDDGVLVSGNANLLATALRNLLINAIRYSPKGTVVEIELVRSPPGFRVLDRGQGVPDELKGRLFERFCRGRATQEMQSGSGIGLAIVRAVAQSHGAQVDVADRPGGGSVFSFLFGDPQDTR